MTSTPSSTYFAVVAVYAHLDQLMGIQIDGNFADDRVAQAIVANHYHRIQRMGQSLEILSLFRGQFDSHCLICKYRFQKAILLYGPIQDQRGLA